MLDQVIVQQKVLCWPLQCCKMKQDDRDICTEHVQLYLGLQHARSSHISVLKLSFNVHELKKDHSCQKMMWTDIYFSWSGQYPHVLPATASGRQTENQLQISKDGRFGLQFGCYRNFWNWENCRLPSLQEVENQSTRERAENRKKEMMRRMGQWCISF